MNVFNFFKILFVVNSSLFWFADKESIMSISGRMSLRLEKSVKVPERGFNITIGFHFFKSHLSENLNKLLLSFHENMKVAILDFSALWIGIELFEMSLFPWSISDHWTCKISNELNSWLSVFWTFWDNEMSLSFLLDQLSLFECFEIVFINFFDFSCFNELK